MKIAIPTQNTEIAPNMGKCRTFTLIDVQEDGSFSKNAITLEHEGNIPVVSMLADQKVDTLICGEIGLMTRSAMEMIEIELIPGCSGNVDAAVSRYLAGEPQGDPSILSVEITMDENDPMQCMHDCANCHSCHVSNETLQQVQEKLHLKEIQ